MFLVLETSTVPPAAGTQYEREGGGSRLGTPHRRPQPGRPAQRRQMLTGQRAASGEKHLEIRSYKEERKTPGVRGWRKETY